MRIRSALALAALAAAGAVGLFTFLVDSDAISSESPPETPLSTSGGREANERAALSPPAEFDMGRAAAHSHPDASARPGATDAAVVQVTVRESGDRPLPGATVAANGTTAHIGATDSNGLFEFACSDGWSGDIQVLADGYYPVTITPGVGLTGRVVDDQGQGIGGATVELFATSGTGSAGYSHRHPDAVAGRLAYNGEELVPLGDRLFAVPPGVLCS